jgi:glycosyltransferase involved in cell wall biosynthesis
MEAQERMRIAVLIPCRNEQATVARVVGDFRAALPAAVVYVYDNASTDGTAEEARRAGAVVRHEPLRGKGNVVRRMFADIEADVYVLVDGDDTYDAGAAPEMVQALVEQGLDMVTGRRTTDVKAAYRPGHKFGNRLLSGIVRRIFGDRISDMLSGYRVLSRRFVKSFPALAQGFEIETELTVHALELRMPMAEIATRYKERPEGSASKLKSYRDGAKILWLIFLLVKEERPLQFFFGLFLALATLSIGLAIPIFAEFLRTGLVPRLPTALLSTALMLLAFLSLAVGLILDTVTHGRREMKRLSYLSIPGPLASGPLSAGRARITGDPASTSCPSVPLS